MSSSYFKRCSRCGESKPTADFNRQSSNKDGLKNWCRECCRVYKVQWDAEHAEQIAAYTVRYAEEHREELRERRRKAYHDKYKNDPTYRERSRQRCREWMAKNPDANKTYIAIHRERLRAIAKARYDNNADQFRLLAREITGRWRAKKTANHVEKIDYAAIIERDNYVCHICGQAIPPGKHQFDHVIPLSKGGPHTMSNVKMAHEFCNKAKKDKLIGEAA